MSTPRRSSRTTAIAATILGLTAGAIIAAGLSMITARGSRRGHATGSDDLDPGASAALDRSFDRPADQPAGPRHPPRTQAAPPSEPPPPVVPPTAREMLAMHEGEVEKHYRKPVDAKWAPLATKTYTDDLAAAGQQLHTHFTVAQVDCRFDTCVAVLDWPSRNQAAAEWHDLLTFPYRASCGRAIVIPEAEAGGGDRPVRAKLVFDCSETKHEPIRQEPSAPLATRAAAAAE